MGVRGRGPGLDGCLTVGALLIRFGLSFGVYSILYYNQNKETPKEVQVNIKAPTLVSGFIV